MTIARSAPRPKPSQSVAAAEEVRTVYLDPNPTPKIKEIGGGNEDKWNYRIASLVLGAVPSARDIAGQSDMQSAIASALVDIKANDPIEGMIAAQMMVANEAALTLYRRAWNPDQSFEVQTKYLELAQKAGRTTAALAEALNRHRGRGQQTVVVKHVTVNAEQAMVADQIVTNRLGKGEGVVEI